MSNSARHQKVYMGTQNRTSVVYGSLLALSLVGTSACGSKSTESAARSAQPASSSKSAAGSAKAAVKTDGSAQASPSAMAAASASGAPSASSDLPAVAREAFCDRAVKLGEANLAKCTKADESSVAWLNFKNEQATAAKDCAARLASKSTEFHGDVAAKCLAAAEKKALMSFGSLWLLPECAGYLSDIAGTTAEGQAPGASAACAPGLWLNKGKCQKPVGENAECSPGGVENVSVSCLPGLMCSSMNSETDGNLPTYHCVKVRAIGEACPTSFNVCGEKASCYQGKCRQSAAAGEVCMNDSDCLGPAACHKEGGVFGKCIALRSAGEVCVDHNECISSTCRGKKCLSICGSD